MAVKWQPPVDREDVVGTGHKWLEPVSKEGLHKAVDVQAVKGTPVKSPVDGVVAKIDNDPEGLGITVTIRDETGKEHTLGHLSETHVKEGDQVTAGQLVADVGSTGASSGAHLDIRIQDQQGNHEDPTALLGDMAQMPRADKPPGWEPPEMGAGQGPPGGERMRFRSDAQLDPSGVEDLRQITREWPVRSPLGGWRGQGMYWDQMPWYMPGNERLPPGTVGGGQDVGAGQMPWESTFSDLKWVQEAMPPQPWEDTYEALKWHPESTMLGGSSPWATGGPAPIYGGGMSSGAFPGEDPPPLSPWAMGNTGGPFDGGAVSPSMSAQQDFGGFMSPWSGGGIGGAFGPSGSMSGIGPFNPIGQGIGRQSGGMRPQSFGGGRQQSRQAVGGNMGGGRQGGGQGGIFAQIVDGGIMGAPDHDSSMTDWFAPAGSQVKAPVSGTVVSSGSGFFGNVGLSLRGDDGSMWEMRHVEGRAQPGMRVEAGQPVAVIQDGSLPGGYQHVDIRVNGQGATPMLRQAGAQAEMKPTSGPSQGGDWMNRPPMGGGGGGMGDMMGGMGGGMFGGGMPGMMGGGGGGMFGGMGGMGGGGFGGGMGGFGGGGMPGMGMPSMMGGGGGGMFGGMGGFGGYGGGGGGGIGGYGGGGFGGGGQLSAQAYGGGGIGGGFGQLSAQAVGGPGMPGAAPSALQTASDTFLQGAIGWRPDMSALTTASAWRPDYAGVERAMGTMTQNSGQPFAPWMQNYQGQTPFTPGAYPQWAPPGIQQFGTGQDDYDVGAGQDSDVGAGQMGLGPFSGFGGQQSGSSGFGGQGSSGQFPTTFTSNPYESGQLNLQQQTLQAQIAQQAAQLGLQQQQLGLQTRSLEAQIQQNNQSFQQAQAQLQQQWLIHQDNGRLERERMQLQDTFNLRQTQLQQELAAIQVQQQNVANQIQVAQFNSTQQQQAGMFNSTQGLAGAQLNNQANAQQQQYGLQRGQLQNQAQMERAGLAQQQQQAGFGRQMEIFNSAMQNPWLQQLSGMAPQWGAPGGPQQAGMAAAQGFANLGSPPQVPNFEMPEFVNGPQQYNPQMITPPNPITAQGVTPGFSAPPAFNPPTPPTTTPPGTATPPTTTNPVTPLTNASGVPWSTLYPPSGGPYFVNGTPWDPSTGGPPQFGTGTQGGASTASGTPWSTLYPPSGGPYFVNGTPWNPGTGGPPQSSSLSPFAPTGGTDPGSTFTPSNEPPQFGQNQFFYSGTGGQFQAPWNTDPAGTGGRNTQGLGQGYNQLHDPYGTGQDNVGAGEDFASWLTRTAPRPYTPPTPGSFNSSPSYGAFQSMSPFEQASFGANWNLMGVSNPQLFNNMRYGWGMNEGVFEAPDITQMQAQGFQSNPMAGMGFGNLLNVFGESPQNYMAEQGNRWSQAQQPSVSGVIGG
jgi:murein DD-endopeptidase MepM/ murein hydrolase activator NlpD